LLILNPLPHKKWHVICHCEPRSGEAIPNEFTTNDRDCFVVANAPPRNDSTTLYNKYSVMPKLHTNHAAKKRFKITASGKILAKASGKQHLNEHMSSKKKRKIRTPKLQVPEILVDHVLRQLPYSHRK